VPITTEVAAEHRMYLPLAAVILLTVLTAHELARRLLPARSRAVGAWAAALAAAVALACLTWQRNGEYASEAGMWQGTIQRLEAAGLPPNPRAWLCLGNVHATRGELDSNLDELVEGAR